MAIRIATLAGASAILLWAESPRGEWGPLAPLSGEGAIGSPGGTHPVAFDGDTAHVVWAQGGHVYYRRSRDGGATWESAVKLTSGGAAQYPCSLEISGSHLHLVWPDSRNGTWEVYYKRSTDGGDTWAEDVRLTPGVDLFRMGTAISGATLHVAWASRSLVVPTPAGTHTWGEIYYKRSTDDGATWEPDVELRGTPARFPHHPQIVASQGGRVCAIWEEGQVFDGAKWSGDPALYACVSDDHGRTWSEPRRITFVNAPNGWATHLKSHACGSRVDLAWTDAPEGTHGHRAAYYMASLDGGLTWEAPERLTSPTNGDCSAESVGAGESAVVVVIARSGALHYRRRAQSPSAQLR